MDSAVKNKEEQEALDQLSERFLRHAGSPSHLGLPPHAHGQAEGVGSCGDSVTIGLCLDGPIITAIGHLPRGCVYTIACASAVCELAQGKTLEQALELQPESVARELGGLPEDHYHCARLAVNTLGNAIAEAYRMLAARSDSERMDDAHL